MAFDLDEAMNAGAMALVGASVYYERAIFLVKGQP